MRKIVAKSMLPTLEQIGLAAEYYPDYRNDQFYMHGVDVILFSVVLSGRGIHYQDGGHWEEDGCAVTITRCGESHSIVTLPGEEMRIVNLYLNSRRYITPNFSDELAEIITAFLPSTALNARGRHQLARIEFNTPERIEPLVLGIVRELQELRAGALGAALDYFRLFLVECGRQALEGDLTHGISSADGEWRLEKVCRYLNRNYADSHTLDEVAALSGWQKNYLCRRFKGYTGVSVFEYIQDLRIKHALLQLADPKGKIVNVAMNCGFADVNYFCRVFRRATGLSPAGYRSEMMRQRTQACREIAGAP